METLQTRADDLLTSPKSVDSDKIKLASVLISSVYKAYEVLGWDIEQTKMDTMVELLPDEVLRHCPFIRLDEIPLAVSYGIQGEYGEYMGINTVSIIKFLKGYYESRRRADAVKKMQAKESPKIPTKEELFLQENEIIAKAFAQFIDKGSFHDYGNQIYNILDRRKIISFSNDRKKGFMSKAKSNLLSANNPEMALNINERRKLQSISEAIQSTLDRNSEGYLLVVREAKRIALNTFFAELREMDEDINDLLEGDLF